MSIVRLSRFIGRSVIKSVETPRGFELPSATAARRYKTPPPAHHKTPTATPTPPSPRVCYICIYLYGIIYLYINWSSCKQYYLRPIRRQRLNNVNVRGPSGWRRRRFCGDGVSRAAVAVEGDIKRKGENIYIVICHRFNNSALFMFTTRVYSKFASCAIPHLTSTHTSTPQTTQSGGGTREEDHLN